MVGDSVRQELASKIKVTSTKPTRLNKKPTTSKRSNKSAVQKQSAQIKLNPPPSPIVIEPKIKSATAEIGTKETNRTLVEFQSKDGTLPEWRTQLKSAVRQRMLRNTEENGSNPQPEASAGRETSQSENDFFDSAEIIEETETPSPENEVLAGALARIKFSREKYHVAGNTLEVAVPDTVEKAPVALFEAPLKVETEKEKKEKASVNFPQVHAFSPNIDLYDTSELDPEFPPANVSSSFGRVAVKTSALPDAAEVLDPATEKEVEPETKINAGQTEVYEDNTATFAYRFNAGLFDMLLTSFASMILLTPFMLFGGSWVSVAGLFAFLATGSIVTFIYLTTTIGLFGKSFGMHLFSLEMIDSNGDEYPSLHQAAVSSSVFLLSMAFAGVGFITCLFDGERRAVHDIVSNTLVVREF
jgi:uncharacterized RDD family membrane protein YckC